jgi:flagellar basal-body rod modification protein FlgD
MTTLSTTVAANAALLPTPAAAAAAAATASEGPSIGDRFLTLLVAQLRNQDPLNPMDNSQMTSQLAQISTVTGINKLNDTMSALSASLGSNQYMQAAGLVGHTVLVPGNKLLLATGAGAGGFNLPSDADHVVVTINDANGLPVRKIDLGAQTAGVQSFAWDGLTDLGPAAADGQYTFTVTATQGATPITADALMSGRVDAVVLGSNGATQLSLGRLGRVDLSQIIEII